MSGSPAIACDEFLAALRAGERHRAFAVVDAAHAAGTPLEDIYLSVLQPALREIGRLWQLNELSVAEEHLATAIAETAMARLFERSFRYAGEQGPTLIAACADVERHEVGLRMICDLLELRGWNTLYLGAAVPIGSLVAMVGMKTPDVLALSVALPAHLPRLRLMIEQVRRAVAQPPFVVVGGRPLLDDATLAARLGADATAMDARAAVALLEERFGPPG